VAAYGLDSMPTGSHFKLRIYDDLVTEDSVTTPEQMEKDAGLLCVVRQPWRAR